MADFCKQCTEDMFGSFEPNDMSGLVTKAQSKEGLYAVVICEGCGPSIVNHAGECVSKNCFKHHGDY